MPAEPESDAKAASKRRRERQIAKQVVRPMAGWKEKREPSNLDVAESGDIREVNFSEIIGWMGRKITLTSRR